VFYNSLEDGSVPHDICHAYIRISFTSHRSQTSLYSEVSGAPPQSSVEKNFALLLNVTTVPFNWINALGPYLGATVFTRTSLSKTFEWFHARSVQLLQIIPEEELKRGMHYPTKWDPFTFKDYMTLEDIFRIPTLHFTFHLKQIAR